MVVSCIRCIIGFAVLLKMGVKPSRKGTRAKPIVKKAMPFAAYEIGNAVYFNIIVIMLFIMQSPEETGWYNAAFRVLMFLILIPAAFETALYPVFSRLYGHSPQDMRFAYGKSMKFSLIVALPVAAILAILAEDFAGLFGADFANTAQCLRFIAIALPLFTLNMLMKTALWSANSQKRMAANIWVSAVVLAIAAYLLVTDSGYLGAALALGVGEAALLILNYLAVRKKKFPMGQYLWKPAAAGAAMFALALLLTEFFSTKFTQYHVAVISVTVYALILLASSTFTRTDKQLLLSALKRDPGKSR